MPFVGTGTSMGKTRQGSATATQERATGALDAGASWEGPALRVVGCSRIAVTAFQNVGTVPGVVYVDVQQQREWRTIAQFQLNAINVPEHYDWPIAARWARLRFTADTQSAANANLNLHAMGSS